MKEIEPYLCSGRITFTSRVEHLFEAEYVGFENKILFRVKSDRGIEHLLLLLQAKIVCDENIEVEANRLYPHSLCISEGELERKLKDTIVEIATIAEKFTVFIRERVIPENQPIGFYTRFSSGTSIIETIRDALSAPIIPMFTALVAGDFSSP